MHFMQTNNEPGGFLSRKKILLWAAALISSVAFLQRFNRTPKKGGQKLKMLTQDGKLVEIDPHLVNGSGKKISNLELQHWVHSSTTP